ncbi:MAG: glutamate--tRNA ligase [Rhodospirillaceae bacterium]|nr:glutamate--tRNA ligase [Rhodospirillaceae bacterium]|tara:strand:- start:14198 stop:15601 length:1404 start_codon:yes stop_codon:yes gene_type:complete
MDITTRFAPSPTGFLHIGGARTALFNFLFAQRFGGKYLLRIEDTDRERSTEAATEAILSGLKWLGLSGQGETVFQHKNIKRHQDIVQILLDNGSAYHCYCTPEELHKMRSKALKEGRKNLYDGSWRDRSPSDAPSDISPVVRLKTELTGKTSINDLVQGLVTVDNEVIDDFILLRADGSPTYMHSVVVDDHDMQVSHVIRGDDHLNNAFRQIQLYKAMDWEIPVFAHIPLIHGHDGTKLSKRHGALGVESYRDLGYLPDALCNYLLRLGWSHGDDEIISREDALKWFDFDKVGQSASRFDITKLDNINSIYIKNLDDEYLIKLLIKELEKHPNLIINTTTIHRIKAGINGLKTRVKTIKELAEISTFYMAKTPLQLDKKARDILNEDAIKIINGLREPLKNIENWSELAIETAIKFYAEKYNLKLANVALPLRVALTGTTSSPSIFEVASVLGWDEVDLRIESVCRK